MTLINTIISKLHTSKTIRKISVIDSIKMEINFEKLENILNNYKNPTEIEKYIIDLHTSKEYKLLSLLSNNYFENILSSVYFTIGNPFSIDTPYFEAIYKEYKIIDKIPEYIIGEYNNIIDKNILNFYNIDIIQKWIESVMGKPVKKTEYFKISNQSIKEKNIKWSKYCIVWKQYNNNCMILKKYLLKLAQYYKSIKYNKVVGCFNISKDLYLHSIKLHVGLDIKDHHINILEKWAFKELQNLQNQMRECIEEITQKKCIDIIKTLKSISRLQVFTSKKEFIETYRNCISKYEHLFIDKFKLPQYVKPTLVVFSNKNIIQAYYNENCFYLNCYNWKNSYKYTVESLVLHESIPGHHTQVHVMSYLKQKNGLLYSYFPSIVNSFVEGWGLWCEKLGYKQTIWDKIGQIEFETFRTLRIIVYINLHYKGYTPQEMIKFMSKYLAMDKHEITNEVYRYVCYPGQALSYKIGSTFFKKLLEKIHGKEIDVLDNKSINLYKKIILDGPEPLCFLLKKYDIDILSLFEN